MRVSKFVEHIHDLFNNIECLLQASRVNIEFPQEVSLEKMFDFRSRNIIDVLSLSAISSHVFTSVQIRGLLTNSWK